MRKDETTGKVGTWWGCLGGIWGPETIREGIARVRREGIRSCENLLVKFVLLGSLCSAGR